MTLTLWVILGVVVGLLGFFNRTLAEQGIWPFTLLHYKKIKLPKSAPIVPTFLKAEEIACGEFLYNTDFYATEETALAVMKRFGAMVAFIKPVHDKDHSAPAQWFIRFSDGVEINAGNVAAFFAKYPEATCPNVAINYAIQFISMERARQLMEGQKSE